jgi:hypothetical protein
MKALRSLPSRPLAALILTMTVGVSTLSACDRQQERLDRVQDIAEGVSDQVKELEAGDQEESTEDGNDN